MTSKSLMLMGVAVVCGLGASYLVSRLVAGRNATVVVLIARQNQGAFTPIQDPATMFGPKEIPRNEVPKNAVLNMDDLKDRILIRALAVGQLVVADDVQDKNKATIDSEIAPGNRLVAIRTDAAGGSILPGSHVDVYHTTRSGDQPEAKLLLEGVLVRAVDVAGAPMAVPESLPAIVTLEVTPEQALTIALAKDTGSFCLAMRCPRDEGDPPAQPEQP